MYQTVRLVYLLYQTVRLVYLLYQTVRLVYVSDSHDVDPSRAAHSLSPLAFLQLGLYFFMTKKCKNRHLLFKRNKLMLHQILCFNYCDHQRVVLSQYEK